MLSFYAKVVPTVFRYEKSRTRLPLTSETLAPILPFSSVAVKEEQ